MTPCGRVLGEHLEQRRRSRAEAQRVSRFARLLPWLITIACFALLYTRIDGAAQRQGSSALPYLMQVFEKVDWWRWLALMIPYSVLFFLVDSLVIWRVVNWFNAKVPLSRHPAGARAAPTSSRS